MRYDLFYQRFKQEFELRNIKPKMMLKIYAVFMAIPHKVEMICIGDAGKSRLSKDDVISFHFDFRIVSIPVSYFKHKNWFEKCWAEIRNDVF